MTSAETDHPIDAPKLDIPRLRAWFAGAFEGSADYSHFVRAAKILLPVGAAGLFLVVVLISMLHKPLSDLKISLGELRSLGGQLEMTNPTLTYADDANRAYFVRANRAVQTPDGKDHWNLFQVNGRMVPPAGRGYHLTSDTGQLDAAKKLLDLAGSVLVVSDEGYTFQARSAHVDMSDNRVTSEEPVRAHGGATTIDSDRFEMWDKGSRLRFEGRVHFASESAPRTNRPEAANKGTEGQ